MSAFASVLGKPAKAKPFAAYVADEASREVIARAAAEAGIATPRSPPAASPTRSAG